jgi:hypothetical protein
MAPEIGVQAPPPMSQRIHWRAYVIGTVPVHVPVVAEVSVCPERACPVTVGRTEFSGAAESTTAVCADVATPRPSGLCPVTSTRIVEPTSALVRVCVAAPASDVHAAPPASQRRQSRVKVIGVVPVQVPSVALRTWPSRTVPEMTGSPVRSLTGGDSGAMTAVAGEVELADPSTFVAVTVTRIVVPTSAVTGVYVVALAPAIGTHAAPPESQRCQARPYVSGAEPAKVPVVEVSVCPARALPVIVGTAVAAGAAAMAGTASSASQTTAASTGRNADERRIGTVIGRSAQNLRARARVRAPIRRHPLKNRPPAPTTRPMTDPTPAVSAATTGGVSYAKAPAAAKATKSFADELARSARTAAASTKAEARPDGEQTKKIEGHPYSRIENGSDKGLFLNQLAGSPRLGSAFRLVHRDDHVFHVYGTGKDRVIVDVKAQSTSDDATTSTTPVTPAAS